MRTVTRVEFLTPTFQPAELVCADAPRGQLPSNTALVTALERVVGIDEAGEDCRQRLARAKMKMEVFNEVVAEVNKGKDPKKSKRD